MRTTPVVDTSLLLPLAETGALRLEGLLAWVTRVDSRVLESPARMRILRLVHERPGICVTDLAASLSMTWGQLHYHLGRLAEAGLLHTVKAGRHRLVFLDPEALEAAEAQAIVLGRTARALALLIVDNPHVTVTDLVRISGETPRVVYYHVKKMLDAGLVTSSSGAHRRGLAADARLLQFLGLSG